MILLTAVEFCGRLSTMMNSIASPRVDGTKSVRISAKAHEQLARLKKAKRQNMGTLIERAIDFYDRRDAVDLPEALFAALDTRAAHEGRSLDHVVTVALRRYLAEPGSRS